MEVIPESLSHTLMISRLGVPAMGWTSTPKHACVSPASARLPSFAASTTEVLSQAKPFGPFLSQ